MNKRRRITYEIEQHLVVKRSTRQQAKLFCSFCGTDTEMLTMDQAISIAGGNGQTILSWIQLGRLHLLEIENESPLICCYSFKEILQINSKI
jgi:hypothetical protein